MSQPGSVHRSLHEGVLTLTMDRPPVHALDDVLVADLQREFEAVDGDPDVGAVVLTATGTRAFCAGKDLRSFAGPDAPVLERVEPGRRGREMLEAIRGCPVPVVAAINGPAVGGGMSIVAMCDCAVAARDAWIQTPEISVGLLGAFNHLASLVGPRRARYLYLSGRRCTAEELLEMGALVAVAEPEELLAAATGIATELAAKSRVAVRLAKQAMERTDGLPLLEAYRLEQDYTFRLRTVWEPPGGASTSGPDQR